MPACGNGGVTPNSEIGLKFEKRTDRQTVQARHADEVGGQGPGRGGGGQLATPARADGFTHALSLEPLWQK